MHGWVTRYTTPVLNGVCDRKWYSFNWKWDISVLLQFPVNQRDTQHICKPFQICYFTIRQMDLLSENSLLCHSSTFKTQDIAELQNCQIFTHYSRAINIHAATVLMHVFSYFILYVYPLVYESLLLVIYLAWPSQYFPDFRMYKECPDSSGSGLYQDEICIRPQNNQCHTLQWGKCAGKFVQISQAMHLVSRT